ncbi:Stk1 family PASTA domain-containing Ser/Thr kinase [Eubacterium sp. 1001713B170207_170306_E7]|uniref:Stk1 family PASTA domain-containing Ser/Thr kinase n=1 Tax=Eubacterium sp. 1001713B170207_170306_E7 TaxID=2787097 RepID=UPI001899E54A|nr:Stk1 family PASTA domain-containing Ser/Thr kinase [Eubacterium sp. 1001713B170207_170306_E7]
MISKVLNNRYEIIELIGRGGMAYVYKAKDRKLNRYVAVKVLREEYTENEQFIKKFDRESQAAAGLSHPNIVSVYDVGVEGDIYYIIMEYVDGITLKQYLNKKGHLDYKEATRFIIDVAAALKCAHEHKIIHRDIKPHNILLTRDLVPKVADFGIARAITSSTVTMTNQTMGSVHYISPEQARGGFVDERSDLYSLGIMYYELLTGQLPFDEENTVTIAIKHIQEELVPPKEILPDIPASVNDVVVKLTRKKPEERYQNMDELIDDLEKIMVDANAAVGDNGAAATSETQIIGDEGLFKIEPVTGPIESGYPEDDEEEEDDLALAQRKKKKKIIGFSIAGGILAVILIVILMNTLSTKAVMVPNVKNMTQEQAAQELEKVGLKLEVESQVYSSDVEAGKIVSQNPEEGREMKKGQTVKVNVSKGTQNVTVPKVIGLTEAEATAAIDKLKLVKNVKREYNSDVATGIVYSVDPGEGVSVAEGTSITLYVSKGQDLVTVPGIVGMSESAAEAQIEDSGLSVGRVTTSESDTVSAGLVISQSPTEGTQTERGTSINFVVSSGKPAPTPTPTPEPTPTPTPKPSPSPEEGGGGN